MKQRSVVDGCKTGGRNIQVISEFSFNVESSARCRTTVWKLPEEKENLGRRKVGAIGRSLDLIYNILFGARIFSGKTGKLRSEPPPTDNNITPAASDVDHTKCLQLFTEPTTDGAV